MCRAAGGKRDSLNRDLAGELPRPDGLRLLTVEGDLAQRRQAGHKGDKIIGDDVAQRAVQTARTPGLRHRVPKPDPVIEQCTQPVRISQRLKVPINDITDQAPELVLGMGVIMSGRQRPLARQASQDKDARSCVSHGCKAPACLLNQHG